MATIKDMSQQFVNSIYELSIFLRLNGHASLGERILTSAVEIAVLSHTSWTTVTNEEFISNLVRTHECAEKLNDLVGVVKYLELEYEGMGKIIEDTEAIYKMSRSSVNTIFSKLGLKESKRGDSASIEHKPSKELKSKMEEKKKLENEIAREGNDTVPKDNEENNVSENDLPYEMDDSSDQKEQSGDEEKEEMSA